MEGTGFYPADILLPKEGLEKWSVVACDQFTSDPGYWMQVEELTRGVPSAGHIIFPEAYLGKINFEEKIAAINEGMERYLAGGLFEELPQTMIYVERELPGGGVRKGVLGALDLESYDYSRNSQSPVRATEGTVVDRLPPRVHIREHAAVELPHILVLIDDRQKSVIEPLTGETQEMSPLYDFELMLGGGHIRGWQMTPEQQRRLTRSLELLGAPEAFEARYNLKNQAPLLFAIGDGNHSLATAKECWKRIKKTLSEEEQKNHPARYALVELGNLHDESLVFEAIHRAVFGVDHFHFAAALEEWITARKGSSSPQTFTLVMDGQKREITIPAPDQQLAVGSIQVFLDQYLARFGGTVDYIHGEEETCRLTDEGAVGILLPVMEKASLFPTVLMEGALPRKTFSMGEAREKRYYLECRKIR